MNYNELTIEQLASVIALATSELAKRASAQAVAPFAAVDGKIVKRPKEPQIRFIKWCLKAAKSGEYIRSGEKDKYALLVQEYRDFFIEHELPQSLRDKRAVEQFCNYGEW